MSESQTSTSGNSETGPTDATGSLAGTPTETPDVDGAAPAQEGGGKTPVTSAAEQETADAQRLDDAVNGENASAEHAADGRPTDADRQAGNG